MGEEKGLDDRGLGGHGKTLPAGGGAVWLLQLLHSPGLLLSARCQVLSSVEGLEQGCSPLLKGQPQIILCLELQNSPHLFLFLWTGFLSQRRERLPQCSPAVNGLSRDPGPLPECAVHTGSSSSWDLPRFLQLQEQNYPQEMLSSRHPHCLDASSHLSQGPAQKKGRGCGENLTSRT